MRRFPHLGAYFEDDEDEEVLVLEAKASSEYRYSADLKARRASANHLDPTATSGASSDPTFSCHQSYALLNLYPTTYTVSQSL